jgi:hypothetical protein
MKRRDVLLAGGVGLAAAAGVGASLLYRKHQMKTASVSPWHMWGSQSTVPLVSTFTSPVVTSSQLCNVKYKRPDTWRFFFFGKLIQSDTVPFGSGTVHARFNLTFGVGRSTFTLGPAIDLTWDPTQVGETRFCTEILDSQGRPFGQFPAETIMVICDANYQSAIGTFNCQVEVGAFVAPVHHARPDWVLHHFAGELEGK